MAIATVTLGSPDRRKIVVPSGWNLARLGARLDYRVARFTQYNIQCYGRLDDVDLLITHSSLLCGPYQCHKTHQT
jgi:hypothetical protein